MQDERRDKIRVLLVDDHPIVREGVRSYLKAHSISVVGEASDATEALRKVKKLVPDVVVLDVNLPSLEGGELARRLRQLFPKTKLIAFSIHSSAEYVARMARCGVQGYVTKAQPPGDLLAAIKQVALGHPYFPAGMAGVLSAPATEAEAADRDSLTGRELGVLTLLAEGFSNKGIAAKLGISVRTAETHRENLAHKLNIRTVAGLTKYALTHGLTALGAAAAIAAVFPASAKAATAGMLAFASVGSASSGSAVCQAAWLDSLARAFFICGLFALTAAAFLLRREPRRPHRVARRPHSP